MKHRYCNGMFQYANLSDAVHLKIVNAINDTIGNTKLYILQLQSGVFNFQASASWEYQECLSIAVHISQQGWFLISTKPLSGNVCYSHVYNKTDANITYL